MQCTSTTLRPVTEMLVGERPQIVGPDPRSNVMNLRPPATGGRCVCTAADGKRTKRACGAKGKEKGSSVTCRRRLSLQQTSQAQDTNNVHYSGRCELNAGWHGAQ